MLTRMRDRAKLTMGRERCLECGQNVGTETQRLCSECATMVCPHCRERYRRRESGGARCVCGERRA